MGLVGSLTLSLPVWLSLYLLVVKELTAAITGDYMFFSGIFLGGEKWMTIFDTAEMEVVDFVAQSN